MLLMSSRNSSTTICRKTVGQAKNKKETKLNSLQISGPQSIKENEVLNGYILNMNTG